MSNNVFEPMSVSRIFDTTFNIYKRNFVRFLAIVAILYVPINMITIISTSLFTYSTSSFQDTYDSPESDDENAQYSSDLMTEESVVGTEPGPGMMILGMVGTIVGGILSLLGHRLYQGALIKSVSEFYLGNDISVRQVYHAILPKFVKLIGAGLLIALVVYAGFILLVVPGVIFGLWFSLTIPVIIAENLPVTAAMSRSKELVKGNLGKVFGVGLLALVISFAINIPFSYGGQILSMIITNNGLVSALIANTFGSIGQLLSIPISASVYILLYYDLRIRKEGFDLEMLAQSMETSPA
jgi:hypothetical protein